MGPGKIRGEVKPRLFAQQEEFNSVSQGQSIKFHFCAGFPFRVFRVFRGFHCAFQDGELVRAKLVPRQEVGNHANYFHG